MRPDMIRCIHFIPVDGVGGVECAAHSTLSDNPSFTGVEIRLMHISACVSLQQNTPGKQGRVLAFAVNSLEHRRRHINNPIAHLWAFLTLVTQKPDVLVCSLWRSMFAGILYKLCFPRVKFICFLHSAVAVRLVDRLFNAAAMHIADAIWADSQTTLAARVPESLRARKRLRTISFILKKSSPHCKLPDNAPVFAYWGRLEYLKGIDRALRFFAAIHQERPDASFYLYGQDEGEAHNFHSLANELRIHQHVHFMGVKTFDAIQAAASKYSYYLLLSRKEGMAMSVVEAMQLGLVPIVTPMGEIANYCCDNVNAVLVESLDNAVNRVLALLKDTGKYRELQQNALARWDEPLLYKHDFSAAVKEMYRENTGPY